MKSITTGIAIAAVILAVAVPAHAATRKAGDTAMAQREASCKAQAAKKYSAVRFLARRDYVNRCMGQAAMGKGKKAKKAKTKAKAS
jgi:hypothetical protein